jgi:hypothetical protein
VTKEERIKRLEELAVAHHEILKSLWNHHSDGCWQQVWDFPNETVDDIEREHGSNADE